MLSRQGFLQLINENAANCAINSVINLLDADELLRSFILAGTQNHDASDIQREVATLLLGLTNTVQPLRNVLLPNIDQTLWLDSAEIFYALLTSLDQDTRDLFKITYTEQYLCGCSLRQYIRAIEDNHFNLNQISVWNGGQTEDITINDMFAVWETYTTGYCATCHQQIVVRNTVKETNRFVIVELPATETLAQNHLKIPVLSTNANGQSFGTPDMYEIVATIQFTNNHYFSWRKSFIGWTIIDGTKTHYVKNLFQDLSPYRVLLYKRIDKPKL